MSALTAFSQNLRSFVIGFIIAMFGLVQLTTNSVAATPTNFSDETYVVKDARLWTEASQFAEPIVLLKAGIKLKVLSYSTEGAWIKVRTPAGREGWVVVKRTTFEGRREKPLIKGTPLEVLDNDEQIVLSNKLEVEGASPSYFAPGGEKDKAVGEVELGAGAILQFSRGTALGLLTEVKYYFFPSSKVSFYMGFGYEFVREKSEYVLVQDARRVLVLSTATDVQTVRKSSEFYPSLGLRLRLGELSVSMGAGWVRDLTTIETRPVGGGDLIYDVDGELYTGSGSANLLFFSFSPSFRYDLGPQSAVAFSAEYQLFLDFSDGAGAFASDTTSSALHNLGLKLSYLRAF